MIATDERDAMSTKHLPAASSNANSATPNGRRNCGRTTNGGEGRWRDELWRAMALTRDFKELAPKRIARDPAFADALLREGVDAMLAATSIPERRSCATCHRNLWSLGALGRAPRLARLVAVRCVISGAVGPC